MPNHEGSHPERFEELCGLAAGGLISESEFVELRAHMEECDRCRSTYDDFVDIVHRRLPLALPEVDRLSPDGSLFSRTSSHRERFLTRARQRGLVIADEAPHDAWRSRVWGRVLGWQSGWAAAAAFAALLLTVGALAYGLIASNARYRSLATRLEALAAQEAAEVRTQAIPLPQDVRPGDSSIQSGAAGGEELAAVREQYRSGQARAKTLEEKLRAAELDIETVRTNFRDANDSRGQFADKLADAEKAIERLNAELRILREGRSRDAALIAAQSADLQSGAAAARQAQARDAATLATLRAELQSVNETARQAQARDAATLATLRADLQSVNAAARQTQTRNAATISQQAAEIQTLSRKARDVAESLDRANMLLADSRDIRDLMTDRNVHVIDVLGDTDSKGKTKRASGRVFYTENKSLMFYAFDLDEKEALKRNASFQLWGARGEGKPAKSLGILYLDSQQEKRWLLQVGDPRVLAEIDSVFVTIEPAGGSAKPNDIKLLYAYLKGDANHP